MRTFRWRPNPAARSAIGVPRKREFVICPATSARGGERTPALRPEADVPHLTPNSRWNRCLRSHEFDVH